MNTSEAKYERIYTESKSNTVPGIWNGDREVSDLVEVVLYEWSTPYDGDTVLVKNVIVDGEWMVQSKQIVSKHGSTMLRSAAIRLAVKAFDDLLAAHPMLGKAD